MARAFDLSGVLMLRSTTVILAATAILASPAVCAAPPPVTFTTERAEVRVVTVAEGLQHPWGLAFLPDGRALVTERPGRLRILDVDGTLSAPLEGVPEVAAIGQGGLLDVAVDPEFRRTELVYLSYAEPRGGKTNGTTVARARLRGTRLEALQVLFRQEPSVESSGHFGGRLAFARDGRLFVTLGERQSRPFSELAQDPATHFGKVVRIERDGGIPADNPFVGREGVRPETWSLGHRNPQGAAIHPVTGELWLTEHGPMGGDELNVARAGRNYGWPVITYGLAYSGARIGEGTEKPGMEQPLYYWLPSIATSGFTFYASERIPGWKGSAFAGALRGKHVARLVLDGDRVIHEERLFEGLSERIRDVREGPDGCLYLLTDSPDGRILRVEPVTAAP